MEPLQIVVGVLSLVLLVVGTGVAIHSLVSLPRRRREIVARVAERFGVVGVRAGLGWLELDIERPGWRGTARALSAGPRLFKNITFHGKTTSVRRAWSLKSRRMLLPVDEGTLVRLPDPELDRRFVAVADRPEDLLSFLDPETQQLLAELDPGLGEVLSSGTAGMPGVAAAVRGDEISVTISGDRGDDEEHLTRALRLIERMAAGPAER